MGTEPDMAAAPWGALMDRSLEACPFSWREITRLISASDRKESRTPVRVAGSPPWHVCFWLTGLESSNFLLWRFLSTLFLFYGENLIAWFLNSTFSKIWQVTWLSHVVGYLAVYFPYCVFFFFACSVSYWEGCVKTSHWESGCAFSSCILSVSALPILGLWCPPETELGNSGTVMLVVCSPRALVSCPCDFVPVPCSCSWRRLASLPPWR